MKQNMRIRDIRATTVTIPLEAPLRHANGVHWGRFVRTIVEVETDNGLIGLGEVGGGGESAEAVFRAMKNYLVGHDPARIVADEIVLHRPEHSFRGFSASTHFAETDQAVVGFHLDDGSDE